jgi:hypothetical protein
MLWFTTDTYFAVALLPEDCIFVKGTKSDERSVQAEREKTVLATLYMSEADVPTTPKEPKGDDPASKDSDMKQIPLFEIPEVRILEDAAIEYVALMAVFIFHSQRATRLINPSMQTLPIMGPILCIVQSTFSHCLKTITHRFSNHPPLQPT